MIDAPIGWFADRVLPFIAPKLYQAAHFLGHSLEEDPDWQLTSEAGSHPTLGFVRFRSNQVYVIFWNGKMDWIERLIVGRALKRALANQGAHQLRREVKRHAA